MIPTVELAPGYAISRLIKGGWQLAGGHGAIAREAALADMAAYVAADVATFDCADIYTGVESLIGGFRASVAPQVRNRLRVHTKCVPDLGRLARLSEADLRRAVLRSAERLRQERLDLVQLHWWDFSRGDFVAAARWLRKLQEEGRIALLGGTNFDATHAALLFDAGVPLATMQVQYSLLDSRPAGGMAALCARTGMRLLCYGTVAGGFLSERWLGAPPPDGALENRSLIKYRLVIEDCGGWEWFQALLRTLAGIAVRHGTDIASVASRWVLDRPHVAAVIVGVRNPAHLARHRALFGVSLDAADEADIATVLQQRHPLDGDVYALERDRTGRHGRIMKYDLGDT